MGIAGIQSISFFFLKKGTKTAKGTQIDLLLDRNDQVINLFELKFYKENFLISKDYAKKLRQKVALFKAGTKTRKQLFLNLLTTFPIIENQHSLGLIDQFFTMDILFDN